MNGKLFIGSFLAGVFALSQTSFSAEGKPVAASMMTQCEENISPGNAANLPKVSEELTPKKQPNFIVILTDDQGWGTTSITVDPAVPESKSDFFKTPNLENLARQGLRFTQAYSGHPNCSPSRAALLTGRSPAALHFTDICGRNGGGLYVGNKIIPPSTLMPCRKGNLRCRKSSSSTTRRTRQRTSASGTLARSGRTATVSMRAMGRLATVREVSRTTCPTIRRGFSA